MMPKVRGSHFSSTHLSTYPSSVPLPKYCSLLCGSPLVRLSSMLPPYEPRRAYHRLGLIQILLQADPLKHTYHCCQRWLHPDRISTCYPSVICVEADVVFPRRQPKIMLRLLGSTDLLKGRLDYCTHSDNKQCQGYQVYLYHPSPRAERAPVVLPWPWNQPQSSTMK